MDRLAPHFTRKEFACKCGCGFDTVDSELIKILSIIRGQFNALVKITSGCRCKHHNSMIGGSDHSQHMLGRAADIKVEGVHSDIIADWIEDNYPNQYGIGRYTGRTHIDTRSGNPVRWDKRIDKQRTRR